MGTKNIKKTKSIYGRKSFNFDLLWVRTNYAGKLRDNDRAIAASLMPDIERAIREDGSLANGRGWEIHIERLRYLLQEELQTHFYRSDIKVALKIMQADGWVYHKRDHRKGYSTWILLRHHDCHIPEHLDTATIKGEPTDPGQTLAECRHCHRLYQFFQPKSGPGYWRAKDDPAHLVLIHA